MTAKIVAVHGIGNYRTLPVADAAAQLTEHLSAALSEGLRTHRPAQEIGLQAAYYADLLRPKGVQGTDELNAAEAEVLTAWAQAVGVPDEVTQGRAGVPLRLVCEWIARWVGRGEDLAYRRILARSVINLIRDVAGYLNHPNQRTQVRERVASAISGHRVVVAHSLGSVVTYETLWAYPDTEVDLLVTVGSPLAVPGAIFDRLEPAPLPNARNGIGRRPPKVKKWINVADIGDLVAVPRPLHERFDGLDLADDYDVSIGSFEIHRFGHYLRVEKTIAVLDEHFQAQ